MMVTKRFYNAPSVEVFTKVRRMSLLNSLSADIIFDDMEDGGDIEGSAI